MDHGYGKGADRNIQLRNFAVRVVGERIIKSAKAYVNEKLQQIVEEHRESMPDELKSDPNALTQVLLNDQDGYVKWKQAKERMGIGNRKWAFVLVDVPLPNAFVR